MRSLVAAALVVAYGSLPILLGPPSFGATAHVRLESTLRFEPQDVTINVGDTVVWVYDDSSGQKHTVTRGSSPEKFDSSPNCPGTILSDDCIKSSNPTFQWRFTTAGDFTYVCKIHSGSGMIGTVHVREVTQSTPPPAQTSSAPPQQTTTSSPSSSASPSPSASASLSASPTDSGLAAGSPGSGSRGSGGTILIALAGVLALGAAGYFVWDRFIKSH
ncbi:MAG: cupredoxin domain-containing protein [Actinomycetota bacterium]